MRRPPDLFELRLDALSCNANAVERALPHLSAPLILTARHPAEGGANHLTAVRRRELLLRFLPHAAYVDVELCSAVQLRAVLAAAKDQAIARIISVHDFRRAPTTDRLTNWAAEARSFSPDVFKIVVLTETADHLETLVRFYAHARTKMNISAMGVGRFGRASRFYFAQHGSALHYVHLGKSQSEGQLSLAQMRRFLANRKARSSRRPGPRAERI